MITLSKYF